MFSRQGRSACKGRSYVVFDIGASSIGAGIAVSDRNGHRLLWATRIEYAYREAPDYTRYERAMYATLLEAGMALTGEGAKAASRDSAFDMRHLTVVAVFAPPWHLGSVRTGIRKKEQPFEITHGIMDEMRGALVNEFFADPVSVSWRDVMGASELLEQYEVDTRLDGYRVLQVERRSAREYMQRSYLAIVSQPVAEQVRNILRRVLPNHDLRMTSSTRLFTQLIERFATPEVDRGFLIEFGGPISSVTALAHRRPAGVATIPLGLHHVLEAAAPNAVSSAEAKGKLAVIVKSLATLGNTDGPPEPVAQALTEWHNEVVRAVRELSGGVTPARNTILIAPNEFLPLFTPVVERPWDMPCVRRFIGMHVVSLPLATVAVDETSNGHNTRLRYLAQAVDDCVA